jgi:multidrug resistance protein, MATE family
MQLSKYSAGSVSEVFSLSLPLMFSCLSNYLIWFVDRFFLTHYSLDALNATVNASALAWGFVGGSTVMAGMIELFVAQYNGSNQVHKIGSAVWQMIWFSLFTSFFFIPIGIFGAHFFYSNAPMEATYFRWSLCFGPLQPLSYALTAYFVGKGNIRGIVLLSAFSILFHGLFDFLLIFGVKDWIPEFGVQGCAIASCLSLTCQAAILLYFFLHHEERRQYSTHLWKFDAKNFWSFSRITAPPAILYNIEQFGWSVFYSLMTAASHTHITLSSLCQSLILLFSFFGDGLARGSAVLANNYLGGKREDLLRKVFKSSSMILILFFTLQILVLGFKSKFFIKSFLPTAKEMDLFGEPLVGCLWFVLLYLLFQGFQWILSNLLYAKGETLFVMTTGSISIWIFLILPTYFLVLKGGYSALWAWSFVALYGFSGTMMYWLRLKSHFVKSSSTFEQIASNQ